MVVRGFGLPAVSALTPICATLAFTSANKFDKVAIEVVKS
jgi:hypothetical protein